MTLAKARKEGLASEVDYTDEELTRVGAVISAFEDQPKESSDNFQNGKWRQYSSLEGGTDTIGYGHKLTAKEIESGKINGVNFADGISDEDAVKIRTKDLRNGIKSAGLPTGWSSEKLTLALDVAHRVGNLKKNAPSFLKALKNDDYEEAFAQTGDLNWRSPDGQKHFYDNRNAELFTAVGIEPSENALMRYNQLQQAAGGA